MPAKAVEASRHHSSMWGASKSSDRRGENLKKTLIQPAKATVFEQGLGASVEAFPMMSLIVDDRGHLVAANPPARAFLRLTGPDGLPSGYTSWMPVLRLSAVTLEDRFGEMRSFYVTPIRTAAEIGKSYVLIAEDPTAGPQDPPDPAVLSEQSDARERAKHLREEAARFKRLSETDPLTGVLNIRAFAARVRQALRDRPWRQGALLFLDLDQFKQINDAHGHSAGDQVLTHVAQRLSFPPHTWIATARVGGDEFALWLPGVRQSSLPDVVAGMRARLERPVQIDPGGKLSARLVVTASIGAACCPEEAQSYEDLKALADQRMYADKSLRASRPSE